MNDKVRIKNDEHKYINKMAMRMLRKINRKDHRRNGNVIVDSYLITQWIIDFG